MAANNKATSKQSTTSLLLDPPHSNFPWSDMASNTFLLPVSQQQTSAEEKKDDSTNAPVQNMGDGPQMLKDPVITTEANESSQQFLSESTPLTQLQQPLRVSKSPSPNANSHFPTKSESPFLTSIPVSEIPSMTASSGSLNFKVESLSNAAVTDVAFTQSSLQGPLSSQTPGSFFQPFSNKQETSELPYSHTYVQSQSTSVPPAVLSQSVQPSQPPPFSTNYHSHFMHSQPPVSPFCTSTASSGSHYDPNIVLSQSGSSQNYNQPQMSFPESSQGSFGKPYSASTGPSNLHFNLNQQYNSTHQSGLPHQQLSKPQATTGSNTLYKSETNTGFSPVIPHWFYQKFEGNKEKWYPFSMVDNRSLEEAYSLNQENSVVPTDGGRYDVYLSQKLKKAVYWEEEPLTVRRATWFYKPEGLQTFVPYEEEFAETLEEFYKNSYITNSWNQKLELPGNQAVIMHNPTIFVHLVPSAEPDEWGTVVVREETGIPLDYQLIQDGLLRPRKMKRGITDFAKIEKGETFNVDHLIFVVHGVGKACDLRLRSLVECVNDFRKIADNFMQTHFRHAVDEGKAGRIEFLPISWHAALHKGESGVDWRMQHISLPSIPVLREIANDTIFDTLYYSSPIYCQTILETVGGDINSLYKLFLSRHPTFKGGVSLLGHSLGSLILFDILSHQKILGDLSVSKAEESKENEEKKETLDIEEVLQKFDLTSYLPTFQEQKIDIDALTILKEEDLKEMDIPMGPRKKLLAYIEDLKERRRNQEDISAHPGSSGHHIDKSLTHSTSVTSVDYTVDADGPGYPNVVYPMLDFHPSIFFAIGSPVAMFQIVRCINRIGKNYRFPTCPAYFNIFHPTDIFAYRMEKLIDPEFSYEPVLIPHHKGRKRMHLELKENIENISKLGTDLKQMLVDSLRYTWDSIRTFAKAHRFPALQVEEEVGKIVDDEISKANTTDESEENTRTGAVNEEFIQIGQLNGGRRIDYVLQKAPFEIINQYLFSINSHLCYWESEDTVLMIVREVYALKGIYPMLQSSASEPDFNVRRSSAVFSPADFGLQPTPPSALVSSNSAGNIIYPSPQEPLSSKMQTHYYEPPAAPVPQQSQPQVSLGPPPLTGFVKKSPIVKKPNAQR